MIRRAKASDLDSLVEIYRQVSLDRDRLGDTKYETQVQKSGFLLGTDTPDIILEEIKNSYMFLVDEDKSNISGYLIADHREEQKFIDDEYKTWFNSELKDFYYNRTQENPRSQPRDELISDMSSSFGGFQRKPHGKMWGGRHKNEKGMTIASLAVDQKHVGKGAATKLLRFLEEKLKDDGYIYLFSIVTLAPVTNCPTVLWHSKNGFKRLAMGRPRRLFDLDNYSGVLLYKKIN